MQNIDTNVTLFLFFDNDYNIKLLLYVISDIFHLFTI